jgi:hypothetical protein
MATSKRGEGFLYLNGTPCDHTGYKNHLTHPCEVCGRVGAKGVALVPGWIAKLTVVEAHKRCGVKEEANG